MNKQQIVLAYQSATNSEKYAITREALEWLRKKQIPVSRQALHQWRNSSGSRTPLEAMYCRAFSEGLKLLTGGKIGRAKLT